jgi:hypothetical protein
MKLELCQSGATQEQVLKGLSERVNLVEGHIRFPTLEQLPKKVSKEYIESQIVEKRFYMMDHGKTMICEVALANGNREIGESNCVDPSESKKDLGMQHSYEAAIEKLWPKEGFLLQWLRYIASMDAHKA